MFEYEFMRNALCAVLLVTPLFGILSTMVVSNRMAFFSDSLGHGAFTGIAIGALIGVDEEIVGLLAFSVVFALLITYIKNKSHGGADTVIGVFSSTAIALGLMLMSAGGQFNKFSRFLIGDLLSITPEDLIHLAAVFVAAFGGFQIAGCADYHGKNAERRARQNLFRFQKRKNPRARGFKSREFCD